MIRQSTKHFPFDPRLRIVVALELDGESCQMTISLENLRKGQERLSLEPHRAGDAILVEPRSCVCMSELFEGQLGDDPMAFDPTKRTSRNEIVENDRYTIGSQLNVELEIVGAHLYRDVERGHAVLGGVSGRAAVCDVRSVPGCYRRSPRRSPLSCDDVLSC